MERGANYHTLSNSRTDYHDHILARIKGTPDGPKKHLLDLIELEIQRVQAHLTTTIQAQTEADHIDYAITCVACLTCICLPLWCCYVAKRNQPQRRTNPI